MSDILMPLRKLHGKLYDISHAKSNFQKMYQEVIAMQKNCGLHVLNVDDTLTELKKGKSMCRFGDGEMEIIVGEAIGFQKKNESLAKRLTEILQEKPTDDCLICVPDALVNFDNLTEDSIDHWVRNMSLHHTDWQKYLSKDYVYGTTNVTRCYMRYADKSESRGWFQKLKNIWSGANVILAEGEETRVGVGNDMLDKVASVRRILCPSENAFDKYDEILSYVASVATKDDMVLLALGPTATVLAWDLAQEGIRALDIGHCDIEYSWCKLGVTKKTVVEGKYVNEDEVSGGARSVKDITDKKYAEEIIQRIL